uniref:Amino acid transporter transmembrane domain-containing protein n=1 Tax=Panagrolaimus sp. JU765 TaxID=591449 RepID=A0AC34QVU8_9BILA
MSARIEDAKESKLPMPSTSVDDDADAPVIHQTGISYFAAFINFFKGCVGVGIFSLPLALKDAGLCGLFMLFLFGFLNCLGMTQLVRSAQYLARKNGGKERLEFGQVAFDACKHSFNFVRPYGSHLKFLVNLCVFMIQIGISAIYYVFVAVHIQQLVEYFTSIRVSEVMYLFAVFVPFVLASYLRNLRAIAVLSAIGSVCILFCIAVIFQYLLRQPHQELSLPWFKDFDGIMTAGGSILYAFEAQALVLPIENKIKKPEQMVGWNGVLSIGMFFITWIYAATAFLGFIVYGDAVKGSIALNLPEEPVYVALKGFLALVVYATFSIQIYVIVELTFPTISGYFFQKVNRGKTGPENSSKCAVLSLELFYRTFLVSMCVLIALCIPNLEQIISFVGSTCGMMIAFFFPPLLDSLTFLPVLFKKHSRATPSKKFGLKLKIVFKIVQNVFLAFLGIFGCVGGLQASIRGM